ncbi:hypothetical protein KY084_03220 [Stakelama sp. CBK3Z-3]|uniref:DUF1648 domain-containing protein n=1 Tax=Stakelama flava TaxID=2860338 RepID=A0ABS6XJ22_9SPHN|nr:hypothetical protein [Stakelama flava]MBW4329884.1 hypothetical protein [Stakelama flava]
MIITGIIIIAMVLVAFAANSMLSNHARIPMQWSLTGKVNWTAPRPFALAFFPVLAILLAIALSVISVYSAPRPGQEQEAVYAIPLVTGLLLVIQCIHLIIARRSLRQV